MTNILDELGKISLSRNSFQVFKCSICHDGELIKNLEEVAKAAEGVVEAYDDELRNSDIDCLRSALSKLRGEHDV